MPRAKYDDTKATIITDSSEDRNQDLFKLPKLLNNNNNNNNRTMRSQSFESSEGGNSSSSVDLRMPVAAKQLTRKKFKRLKPNVRVDSDSQNGSDVPLDRHIASNKNKLFTNPATQSSSLLSSPTTTTTTTTTTTKGTPGKKKSGMNVSSIRHIIVTIPDYMRTQLGFNKKKAQKIADDSTSCSFSNSNLAIISESNINPHYHLNLTDHSNHSNNHNNNHNIETSVYNYNNSDFIEAQMRQQQHQQVLKLDSKVYLDGINQINSHHHHQHHVNNRISNNSNNNNNNNNGTVSQTSLRIPNYEYAYNYEFTGAHYEHRPNDSKYSLAKNYVLTDNDLDQINGRERSDTPDILASFAPTQTIARPPINPRATTATTKASRTNNNNSSSGTRTMNDDAYDDNNDLIIYSQNPPRPKSPKLKKPGTKSGRLTYFDD